MRNILLVEPSYRSKFPPLGLMRISAYHKDRGDCVTFARGCVPEKREVRWDRVYISTLFTYELPRTVRTIWYYLPTVSDTSDILVGGIGASLLPDYIRARVNCQVIEGPLDRPNMLGLGEPPIAEYMPDYHLPSAVDYDYLPKDCYFVRASVGCIRKCHFCAVPRLEPEFRFLQSIGKQLDAVRASYGEMQHLVVLDNNILALSCIQQVISEIRDQGFSANARFRNRKRIVDFNQGIDARLVTPQIARLLASICLEPVRLAFDNDRVEADYRRAVHLLVDVGFRKFTTYVMYNYDDDPESFFRRLRVNVDLSEKLGVQITGFPMRHVPIDAVDRRYISPGWNWRYLRGIQCILRVRRGIVSHIPSFFEAAFGRSFEEFLEITSMPDDYIIYRSANADKAEEWRRLYRTLGQQEARTLCEILQDNRYARNRSQSLLSGPYAGILQHYYPELSR